MPRPRDPMLKEFQLVIDLLCGMSSLRVSAGENVEGGNAAIMSLQLEASSP